MIPPLSTGFCTSALLDRFDNRLPSLDLDMGVKSNIPITDDWW